MKVTLTEFCGYCAGPVSRHYADCPVVLMAENKRLRAALHSVLEEHGYGLPPETNKYIRAALLPTAEQETK